MSRHRVSIFGDAEPDALDIAGFAPKSVSDVKAPPVEQVRAVAQAANFPSRESATASKAEPKTKVAKREPRLYRTGRNVQLSVKASKETVDAFYAVTEAQPGWVLGYTLQRAIEALKRELDKSK